MDRGAWWATVRGVAESQTRLSTQHACFFSKRAALPAIARCFCPPSLRGPGYPLGPLIGIPGI